MQGGFEVRLHRSGRTISIPEGETILRTLLDAGVKDDRRLHVWFSRCKASHLNPGLLNPTTAESDLASHRVMVISE